MAEKNIVENRPAEDIKERFSSNETVNTVMNGLGKVVDYPMGVVGNLTVKNNAVDASVKPGKALGQSMLMGIVAFGLSLLLGNGLLGSLGFGLGAGIMGQEVVESARMAAFVKCTGTCEKTKDNYNYTGVEDCEMMAFIPGGGSKACNYGCMGFGSCVKACPFDAIHIVNGVAVVDREACKACGKCIAKCPHHLIELAPYDQKTFVGCSSHAKGKAVTTACELGCIGCKKCEKTCPNGAITVTDFCAHIDYEKCTNCGACKEACPRHVIL